MDSPSTPQGVGQSRGLLATLEEIEEHPINLVAEQLQRTVISKRRVPERKREQSAPTPASQARPRTQRRCTLDEDDAQGQEDQACHQQQQQQQDACAANAPAGSRPGPSSSPVEQQSFTPSRLSCIAELQEELSCGICLEICVRPCATPCGHNFCRRCLRQALQHKRQCPQCREVLPPATRWQPKVNTALWNTIQLLFPQHAAEAPPPTPPGQQQQPAAAALAAAAGGRGRVTRGASVAAAGGREPGGPYAMAEAVAAHRQQLLSDAATRQPFRPPRMGISSTRQGSRQQQQQQSQAHATPVLEPELAMMLHSLTGRTASMQQQQQLPSQQQPSQNPMHMAVSDDDPVWISSRRRRNPFARSSHTGSSQQRAAGMLEPAAGGQISSQREASAVQQRWQQQQQGILGSDTVLPLEGTDDGAMQLLSGFGSPVPLNAMHAAPVAAITAVAGAGPAGALVATRRLRGQPAALPSRTSRAAAARPTADVEQISLDSSDEDVMLQEAMMNSLRSAAQTSRGGSAAQLQQQQQDQRQRQQHAPVFGRIHSGSSPRQFWADLGEPTEPDWLLLDADTNSNSASQAGTSVEAQQQRRRRQQQQEDEMVHQVPPGSSHDSRASSRSNAAAAAVGTATSRQTTRTPAAIEHGLTHAAVADDIQALLEDLSDEEATLQFSRSRNVSRTHAAPTAAAPAATAAGRAAAVVAAVSRPCIRRHHPVIVDDDLSEPEDCLPDIGVQQSSSSSAATFAAPAATSSSNIPVGPSTSQQLRGRCSRVTTDEEAQGNAGTGHDAAAASASERHSAPDASVRHPAAAAAAAPELHVAVLSLAYSPEPQPLFARLARRGDNSSTSAPLQQRQQQLGSHGAASRHHAVLPDRDAAGNQCHTQSSSRGLVGLASAGATQSAGPAVHPDELHDISDLCQAAEQQDVLSGSAQQSQSQHVGSLSDDEDDFQPRGHPRSRLTAARASALLGAAAGGRRVVPALRARPARRSTRAAG